MKRYIYLLLVLLISESYSQQFTIKFATLAPEGTTWMNIMREYDTAIRKESGGRLGFKIYAGGVQGDEKDILRKIRLGQLHSTGITGVGIGEIAPKVRILDSPFLFKSYEEIDHIYKTYDKDFHSAFEEGGYVLLGWAEVGFVYVFTNTPIAKKEDMKNVKMWMWEGDPIAEATFKSLDISPIPLSVTDVLTSLQTKLIDGVYTSPLAAVGLQWWTRVKHVFSLPLADAVGAVVISKKMYNQLSPDLQEILLRNGKIYMTKLTDLSRKDNEKALQTLKNQGLKFSDPVSQNSVEEYEESGRKARRSLVNKLYTEEFLNRIEQTLADFRKSKNKLTQ
ncbi:MAG: TRAP transporter substrate-binding protein DctP [Bacteroidota bacterium]|nr:TRAP transporter substrate-binding protein DctP [Bacteroidota bacterium]